MGIARREQAAHSQLIAKGSIFLHKMTTMKLSIGKILPLALFGILLGGLAACANAAEGDANSGSISDPGAFVNKTPHLPTTYIDTSGHTYPWTKLYNVVQSIGNRIPAPAGYKRLPAPEGSFATWLRGLPLKPGRPDVLLYNGEPKGYQGAQHAVLDMDVGDKDLQQCADAVMRLRAEYLFSRKDFESIHFNFTSGDKCDWERWRKGYRPVIRGNSVTWSKSAAPSDSYANFKKYLVMVFSYAGTASLAKELKAVGSTNAVEAGDVFIQGGFPGHAIMVMDVAENAAGERIFLLAQSYMPAQEMHVLVNPADEDFSPWYKAGFAGRLETPEWGFQAEDLKRFAD